MRIQQVARLLRAGSTLETDDAIFIGLGIVRAFARVQVCREAIEGLLESVQSVDHARFLVLVEFYASLIVSALS